VEEGMKTNEIKQERLKNRGIEVKSISSGSQGVKMFIPKPGKGTKTAEKANTEPEGGMSLHFSSLVFFRKWENCLKSRWPGRRSCPNTIMSSKRNSL